MGESSFRQSLLRAFKHRRVAAVAIENKLAAGTPDVAWRGGWLELKSVESWPVRMETPVESGITREQLLFGIEWTLGGGRWYLVVKVRGAGIFVFDAKGASAVYRGQGREWWWKMAAMVGRGEGEVVAWLEE